MSEKIVDLERKVKDSQFRQQEDRMSLEAKLSSGLSTKADLQ